MRYKRFKKTLVFIIFIFLAVLLRYYVSNMGNNYDYGSWKLVGSFVADGKNVYAETSRYSYGPFWALTLGFFKQISLLFYNDLFIFRSLIILSLSLADIMITLWLYEYIGSLAIFWFLFNPVSIYISGFHNQFDNMAIAIALYSFKLIEKYKSHLKGYVLLGFSLIVKHVFIFFPLWLFISAKNTKQRLFSLIPLLVFFVSFLPFLSSQKVITDIWNNVFTYKRDMLYSFLPNSPLLTPVIIFCFILPFGLFLKNEKVSKQGLLYLLLIVAAFTNSGGQYLAIPLVAYAVLDPFMGLIYTGIALQNIVFHSVKLETSLIPAFQLSWLVFLRKYYPKMKKPLKFAGVIILFISVFYSMFNFVASGKDIFIKERKNIWFMQSLYPADKVFSVSKEKSKQPLTSGTEIIGQFKARQNNLGFITLPFLLENPKGDFFNKGYKVTVKIQEIGNPSRNFQEIRTLKSGLTGEGILLGFPILSDSNGKMYEISVFTDVPKEINYLTVNLGGKVQVRYFLSRSLINSPYKIIQFTFNKIYYFFHQETYISLLLQLYSYLWFIVIAIKLLFLTKKY